LVFSILLQDLDLGLSVFFGNWIGFFGFFFRMLDRLVLQDLVGFFGWIGWSVVLSMDLDGGLYSWFFFRFGFQLESIRALQQYKCIYRQQAIMAYSAVGHYPSEFGGIVTFFGSREG